MKSSFERTDSKAARQSRLVAEQQARSFKSVKWLKILLRMLCCMTSSGQVIAYARSSRLHQVLPKCLSEVNKCNPEERYGAPFVCGPSGVRLVHAPSWHRICLTGYRLPCGFVFGDRRCTSIALLPLTLCTRALKPISHSASGNEFTRVESCLQAACIVQVMQMQRISRLQYGLR